MDGASRCSQRQSEGVELTGAPSTTPTQDEREWERFCYEVVRHVCPAVEQAAAARRSKRRDQPAREFAASIQLENSQARCHRCARIKCGGVTAGNSTVRRALNPFDSSRNWWRMAPAGGPALVPRPTATH